MQGLERAEGAEESQDHKALGIHRPCLRPVCAQRGEFLSFTVGQQCFEIQPRAARENSSEYVGSGLGSGKARVRVKSFGPARPSDPTITCDLVERERNNVFCFFW